MSTNLSKEKRNNLLKKLEELKRHIENQDEKIFLDYLKEIENELQLKKYGLVFEEHKEQVDEKLDGSTPVFVEEKPLFINNGGKMNFLIEGDNLAALELLTKTHKNKIDFIYIDPPYNTGNKDFIYDDKFIDKNDTFKHSKWLSFMRSRLTIAKKILTDDGVIFISISDKEQAQLKILCDSIFGESNLVSNLIWQRKTGASDANGIATVTEYILVYINKNYQNAKKIFSKNYESHDINRYRHKDDFYEQRGPYYIDNLDRGGLQYSDSMNYGIECPDGTITYPNGRVSFEKDGWTWKWGRDKVEWAKKEQYIEFRKSTTKASGWSVCYKNYLNVDNDGNSIDRGAPHKNLILNVLNGEGTKELTNMFGKKVFTNPKPVKLIKMLLKWIDKKNITVLDFFAGSGTTGQAVIELNKQDGGNRNFILVTNNENNICRDVTYERLKKVIQGYSFKGNKETVLFEKQINWSAFKNSEKAIIEINRKKENEKENYDEFKVSIKNGELKLSGIKKVAEKIEGIPSSLKYLKTDFISTEGKFYYEYADELMVHIKELIELENASNISFDIDDKICIILSDDEMIKFVDNIKERKTCNVVYLSNNVLASSTQLEVLRSEGIEVNIIPDYYYKELRG